LLQFFEKYGFVVVRNVLTSQECSATISEIWDIVEGLFFFFLTFFPCLSSSSSFLVLSPGRLTRQGAKREQPWTWNNWSGTGLSNEGIVGYDPFFTPVALKNRINPTLHKVSITLSFLHSHYPHFSLLLFQYSGCFAGSGSPRPLGESRSLWALSPHPLRAMERWSVLSDYHCECCLLVKVCLCFVFR